MFVQLIIVLKKVTSTRVFQGAVLEKAPLLNISRHYATTKSAICALWKYSAWQFQSAVQYIRTLLLKMPFEISDLCHLSIIEFLFERPSFGTWGTHFVSEMQKVWWITQLIVPLGKKHTTVFLSRFMKSFLFHPF